MAKLDVYLRSIERFGAAGAILTSGQAVTLRFPTGDRHATQVTPHDQLVGLVREVAPPAVLDQIDKHRPAKFEHDSNGTRYSVSVAPRPGAWQVSIEPVALPPPAPMITMRPQAAAPVAATTSEMTIERGQYDPPVAPRRVATSGSVLLDELTHLARTARASDLYLGAGAAPLQRILGELSGTGGNAIDGDLLAREIGLVAPQEARAKWSELGSAVFAYGDGIGRVRVTLSRDHRGPSASLRLLPDEAPPLDRLNLGIDDWLTGSGLVVIAGPSGAGKTVTLAILVRALGERGRRVITIEDPIELLQDSPSISQRAVGAHVASVAAGVGAAMLECADAIAVGAVASTDTANAVIDALAGGHLTLMTIVAPGATAIERLVDLVTPERRTFARALVGESLRGMIHPIVSRGGRTIEIARAGGRT